MFKSILRLLGTILIAVAFAFVLIMCVGERTKVSGHSMEPHLHDHDQVLLDKLTYRFRDRTSRINGKDHKRKSLCKRQRSKRLF